MKKLLLLSTIFVLSSLIISAQTPAPTPTPRLDVKTVTGDFSGAIPVSGENYSGIKPISGGVLNGKANNLPKPAYPAAARAVNAGGAVSVQVLIDEAGNVTSAVAVSGHPLLRQASEQAALAAKFAPTTLSGQAVRVSGILVYNFVPATTISITGNWYQTGMSLSALEKMPTLKFFEPSSLNYMISSDWTAEREQIKRLDELKQAELESSNGDEPKSNVIDERNMKSGDGKNPVRVVTSTVTVSPDQKVSAEASAISQSLIASIQGRLAGNPLDLWYFNLGINVNKALLDADSTDAQKRLNGVKPFRDFIKNPPSEISEEILVDLEQIALLAERGVFSNQDKINLTKLMMKLNSFPRN